MRFHIGRTALTAALAASLIASAALSQERDARSMITELGQRATALSTITEAKCIAARIIYVQTVAIHSDVGEWPEEVENWPSGQVVSKFVYDVNNLLNRACEPSAPTARDGVFTDGERPRMEALLDDLETLVVGSQTLYALLEGDQIEDANAYFRDHIREPYLDLVASAYTVGTGVTRDISRIGLLARTLD